MKLLSSFTSFAYYSATLCRMDVCGGSWVVGGFGTIPPSLRSLWLTVCNNWQNKTQYFVALTPNKEWPFRVSITTQVSNMVTQWPMSPIATQRSRYIKLSDATICNVSWYWSSYLFRSHNGVYNSPSITLFDWLLIRYLQ